MIRSMTGYGSSTETVAGRTVTVESRSVNSRGVKIVVKAPPGLEGLDIALRDTIEANVRRGRVDVFVRIEEEEDADASRVLDDERVEGLLAGLARLREEFGVPGEADLATLAAFGGLFRERPREPDPEATKGAVQAAATRSLAGLVEMREREGRRLETDLRERLTGLAAGLDACDALAPARLERERARLKAAVEEVTGKGFDEDRLAREIALIADRWDVGEELVRARSHLAAFDEYLKEPSEEPVGKRLGFLVQELQREVNTLGAKANDVRISRQVVEMKNEIERLREQVENVE